MCGPVTECSSPEQNPPAAMSLKQNEQDAGQRGSGCFHLYGGEYRSREQFWKVGNGGCLGRTGWLGKSGGGEIFHGRSFRTFSILPCVHKLRIFLNPPVGGRGELREPGGRTEGALKAWREGRVQLRPGMSG